MYENEAAHVRLGIEFLQAMTEEDYLLDHHGRKKGKRSRT